MPHRIKSSGANERVARLLGQSGATGDPVCLAGDIAVNHHVGVVKGLPEELPEAVIERILHLCLKLSQADSAVLQQSREHSDFAEGSMLQLWRQTPVASAPVLLQLQLETSHQLLIFRKSDGFRHFHFHLLFHVFVNLQVL